MDIQGLKATSHAGNKCLLGLVDRATSFLFGFSPPRKAALQVSQKLLELLLISGYLSRFAAIRGLGTVQM